MPLTQKFGQFNALPVLSSDTVLRCFQHLNLSSLPAFLTAHLGKLNLLTFRERLVIIISHDCTVVNKNIFAGFIDGESVALGAIKPLNAAGCFGGITYSWWVPYFVTSE